MFIPHFNSRVGGFALILLFIIGACDGGLAPNTDIDPGILSGVINYTGSWPSEAEIQDIRFVALRFIPQDTADFLQLNRLEASDRLQYGVTTDSFVIRNIEPGIFPFNGVARRSTSDLLSWGPLALYDLNDGIIEITPGDSVHIIMNVNLDVLPDFP